MSSMSLQELFATYKNWVSTNPQTAGDVESTVKWLSYFIAGRINSSNVFSELVYSLSNLLVLFNDRIIYNARKLNHSGSSVGFGETLKTWLTVLDYSEVFIEVSFRKNWGERGRWAITTLVQVVKCIARLVLLFHYKENIIKNPPIAPLKRDKLNGEDSEVREASEESIARFNSATFTLRQSGRVIRTVHAAPPSNCRTWKPPVAPIRGDCDEDVTTRWGKHIAAETLYAVKPIIHLGSMYCFGQRAWKPYILSLAVDLASLHLYKRSGRTLSKRQRLELSRRSVALLLYALRSPFYERHSRDRLQSLLRSLSQNLPLARLICTPIAQYIPQWQDTYFYMWSS